MKRKSRKLHIGCFDQVFEGWLNTDVTPHIFVARIPGLARILNVLGVMSSARLQQHNLGIFRNIVYMDVTRRFPFGNNAFDYAYSSHMLEHLTPDKAAHCVKEIHRVLAIDGVVRIAVPDLDDLISTYDAQKPDDFLSKVFECRSSNSKDRHHWHYNAKSLEELLKHSGFRRVHRCKFREGACADVESLDTRPDSLIMEAVK